MGVIEVHYCDTCGTEMESQEYTYRLTGLPGEAVTAGALCKACYDTIRLWFDGKRKSASEQWILPDVTPEEPSEPSL